MAVRRQIFEAAASAGFVPAAAVIGERAGPAGAIDFELDGALVFGEIEVLKWQILGGVGLPGGAGQSGGELRLIECGAAGVVGRVYDDELLARGSIFDVPKAIGLANPIAQASAEYQAANVAGQKAFGALVVGKSALRENRGSRGQ